MVWKGVVPDMPPAKLIETIGAPYHLLKQLPPILNLMPLLPTDPPFAPFSSLERVHKEDVDAITTVKRWRLGFEVHQHYSNSLLANVREVRPLLERLLPQVGALICRS